MTERTDVVIVGSGGGGAVLGLALARMGIGFRILERSPVRTLGVRSEILQPNGQEVLDRLGLLQHLRAPIGRTVHRFNFYRVGGRRLFTVDYSLLPPPYNQAIVVDPEEINRLVVHALEELAPGSLSYGSRFMGITHRDGHLSGVKVELAGRIFDLDAKLVVGADGAKSSVRESLGIPTQMHSYRDAFIVTVLDDTENLEEGEYFIGRRTILGFFPAGHRKVYVIYMIPAGGMQQLQHEGLDELRTRWVTINPRLKQIVNGFLSWDQAAYLPTVRVRAQRWVTDGAAIIGDAAHAMNPHSSQGRMQAMMDATTLAEVISSCVATGDWSANKLAVYESKRRPQVENLQRLADEQVFLWNTGNPLLAYVRDRIFGTLDRNLRLRYRILAATAGVRTDFPLGFVDRLMAAGLIPDPKAHILDL